MLFFILPILFFSECSFANQVILDIEYDDLPKMLLKQNKLVKGQALLTESQKIKANHLTRSFLPTAKLEVGEETYKTEQSPSKAQPFAHVEAKMNLFRGNRDLLEDRFINNQIQQSHLEQEDVFAKELNETRKLFWEIVYTRELLQLLEIEKEKNKKNLQISRHRVQRGLGPKVDMHEFEIRESEILEEIESLQHENKNLQIHFSGFFNLDPETNFKTQNTIPHIHDEELLAKKLNSGKYREVQLTIKQQESLQIQKLQTPVWWVPTLDLYSGYYLHNTREKNFEKISDRDEIVAGVKLSFDLFDAQQSKIKSASLQLQSEGTKLKVDQLKTNVNVQIALSKEEIKHEHELIHNMEQRIDKWKFVFNKILEEYNVGVKSSLDVLEASEKYLNLQKEYILRRKNYQLAKIQLLSYIGE